MITTNLQAILFDLDGVLVDSKAVVEAAWRRWAAETGAPAEDLVAIMHGRPARELVRMFAPTLDAEREAERVADYEMDGSARVLVQPGAAACVELARRAAWAIVTSGTRALALRRIESVGLPAPDVLISADEVTAGKPDPQPYELAAERLGVAPRCCIVVEDSPAGVLAGRRAGATVLAVTTTHQASVLGEADRVLASMVEVEAALRAALQA